MPSLKNFNVSHSPSNLNNQNQTDTQDIWRWLDTGKSIKHQFKSDPPFKLFFRVRFYVLDPTKLLEENTRYQFFMQLRNDILDGKLTCSHSSLVKLCSYVVQSELGDYAEEHKQGYLSDIELVPNQNSAIEKEISELHKLHVNQTPAQAEINFLQHAKTLDTYGIECFKAKDANNTDIIIGVGSVGIVIFENELKVNSFVWSKIVKLSFKSKNFYIQLRRENHIERYETIVSFNLLTYRQCKLLWKCCVQTHSFFRLRTQKPQTKKLFFFLSLGSSFRYRGRTEFQALEAARRMRPNSNFSRTPSKRYARQTVPSFHSSQQTNDQNKIITNDLSATSSINTSTGGSSFWRNGLSSKILNNLSSSVMKHNMRSLTKLNSNSRKNNGTINNKLVTSTSNSELTYKVNDPLSLNDSNHKLNCTNTNQTKSITNNLNSKQNSSVIDSILNNNKSNLELNEEKLSALNSINKSMNQKRSSNQLSSTTSTNLISSLKSVGNTSKMKITESSNKIAKEAWICNNKEER